MRGRRWRWVLLVVVLVAAIVWLWDWNWFKLFIERRASAAVGRSVAIGHFSVRLSRHPLLVFDQVSIGNPSGFPAGSHMADIGELNLRLDGVGLFHHRVRLELIDLEKPVVALAPGADGTPNWRLQAGTATPGNAPSASNEWTVDIVGLAIHDGNVHVTDPAFKSDFSLLVQTRGGEDGSEPSIQIDIDGRYAGQPIEGQFVGGSILGLRNPDNPYALDLKLRHGATHVELKGTLIEPLKFGGADLRLNLAGDDLASLYPLTGIPLAPTPPYSLAGRLDYVDHRIRFSDIAGSVGSSDLEGHLEVDPGKERRFVTADLKSRDVVMADLAGFIGGAPGKADAPTQAPKQKAAHQKQEASGKLLPDKPINLPEIRSADARISYEAEHIRGESTPIDHLSAKLELQDGALSLKPLSFAIGQGQIVLNIRLEAQQDVVHAVGDIDFRQVDLHRLMQATGAFKGDGTIGGRASIDTHGNSMAQMLANGNGWIKLFVNGGNISALLVDLAGLDFGNGVLSALGLPEQAPLRCMVSDFNLDHGDLKTQMLLIDTTEANIVGDGHVDLRSEQIDYRVSTEPKHFSVGHLRAPILLRGPLKSPSILPEPGQLAARGSVAAVLGVFLTPLAALIPTIELGLGKDHNCGELLAAVQNAAHTPPPRH